MPGHNPDLDFRLQSGMQITKMCTILYLCTCLPNQVFFFAVAFIRDSESGVQFHWDQHINPICIYCLSSISAMSQQPHTLRSNVSLRAARYTTVPAALVPRLVCLGTCVMVFASEWNSNITEISIFWHAICTYRLVPNTSKKILNGSQPRLFPCKHRTSSLHITSWVVDN